MRSQGQAVSADARDPPPEIAFLLGHGVPAETLRDASAIAAASGVSADEALLRNDLLPEGEFYRALARELGVAFVSEPSLSPLAHFPNSILAGIAPALASSTLVVAPQGPHLARLLSRRRHLATQIAVTTPTALRRAVFAAQGPRIAHQASHTLQDLDASLSSRERATPIQSLVATAVLGVSLAALSWLYVPGSLLAALAVLFHVLFLGMVFLRLSTVLTSEEPSDPWTRPIRDAELPVYTVIVALYREKRVASRLLEALRALDYPAAKLDIKLVLEEDDPETPAALADAHLPGFVEIIVAPPGSPRTKPRALNVALPLARGPLTVIYDAEDVPDPRQLRQAAAAFRRQPPSVACLQARLTIDNADDTWLTRLFAIEYAALFDVINPGLVASGLPIPLGGTSNHFRTAILRKIGGWDAWNVTEDADLGIRLARFGYATADLPSSTFEEAPQRIGPWMRQRTRWMKGFLQTCITHSRRPGVVWRQLGPARFAGAFAMLFGAVASVLVYPLFTAMTLTGIFAGRLFRGGGLLEFAAAYLSVYLFGLGVLSMVVPAVLALHRRRLWRLLPFVLLLPFYYGLVSIAAWRSIWELWRHPFRWNKTDHGWARSSRRRLTTASEALARPRRAAG